MPLRPHAMPRTILRLARLGLFTALVFAARFACAADSIPVDLTAFRPSAGVRVTAKGDNLTVIWPMAAGENGILDFDLRPRKPLIASIAVGGVDGRDGKPIATNLNPLTVVTIGSRDLTKPEGWTIFFDKTYERPYQTVAAVLDKKSATVTTHGLSCTVRVGDLTAGAFHGAMEFTVYPNSRLVRADAVLRTAHDGTAILYDAGLTSASPDWRSVGWRNPAGEPQSATVDTARVAAPVKVQSRTVVAQGAGGSLALFPPPHQYFYPLDFVTNMGYVWYGKGWRGVAPEYGLGIRLPVQGDGRWVPWFNAPPNVDHHLSVYYLLARGDADHAIAEARRYTHDDRYVPLPGYKTYTSHYHLEHTLKFLAQQKAQNTTGIPKGQDSPGFVRAFRAHGVDIVHLAEFHNGDTPNLPDARRLPQLKTLFAECARLSDDSFLLLPGEEPNVWLGGHWISEFPKPVYWVLNRPAGTPFAETIDGYGTVYHVGDSDDVLRLMTQEHGLMYTAHARIKASRGFPDGYWNKDFFRSDRFLGAAWKNMPTDLSLPRLGTRVLDLTDDMANAGMHKTTIGEVDAFDIEPDFEMYGPMNINYVKLDRLPRFADGWQPVMDSLRAGKLFVTTGEILLPSFAVGGAGSGETLALRGKSNVFLDAKLTSTFPLAYAEIITGDGAKVYRQRIDLTDTPAFGDRTLHVPVDLTGKTWARLEVWDTAVNGAFTEPVWVGP